MANDDYIPDPEDFSIVRPSDTSYYEFGRPSTYQDAQVVASSAAATAEDDALALLRQSLQKSPEITPSQGLAAALLAAIPTIGGYMIGKSVGDPDIPAGVYGVDLTKYQTGGAAGGIAGAKLGLESSSAYLDSLSAQQQHANEVRQEMAKIEANEFARQDTARNQLINDQMQLQAQAANQQEYLEKSKVAQLDLERQMKREELGRYYQDDDRSKHEGAQLVPEETKQLWAKELGVDPSLIETKADLSRLIAISENRGVNNRATRAFEFREGQTQVPGYKNYSGAVLAPTLVKEINTQNFGIAKTNQLIDQYLSRPDSLTGQESAVQAAIGGQLVNAQRLATGSGANFTEMEKRLIYDALPAIKAGNLSEWMKRNALGRDQKVFAETLKSIYRKTQDYALAETYGLVREDVPLTYYSAPLLSKWGLIDSSGSTGATGGVGGFKSKEQFLAEARKKRGLQ